MRKPRVRHEPANNPSARGDHSVGGVDSEARMNDTTWTPGPWRILGQVALHKVRFGVATRRGVIIDADNEADARLIAAAPEMAECLQAVRHALVDTGIATGHSPNDSRTQAAAALYIKVADILARIEGRP